MTEKILARAAGKTAVQPGDNVWVKADVLMTGDVFRSTGYPNIDLTVGGSLNGMIAALRVLLAEAGPNTTVVPGHGNITNRAAIHSHLDMAVVIRDRVAALIAQGKTQE